ncbi:hypothetical protein BD769DRAFT_1343142, partial [Suillus cothurnatus]
MDIKFIGSGASAKAILYYITDYITKSQLKAHVAYAALDLARQKLSEFNPADDELTIRAKELIRKSAHAMISHQELSSQQVAAYLMDFGDHYTSHRYANLFWTDNGALISRANQVQDYQLRSTALKDMCIWDFVAQVEKRKLNQSECEDDTDLQNPADAIESDFANGLEGDFVVTDDVSDSDLIASKENINKNESQISIEGILKDRSHTRPTYELRNGHVERRTHRLVVRHPDRRHVPVPIGPSLPRRDRVEVREKYCRVMLILFKPWMTVDDLRGTFNTWSDAFEDFVDHCSPNKTFIMKNMQIFHECKDSRDDHFANRRQ